MKTIGCLSIALACVVALSTPAAAQDPLSQAKGLYDSASYSEALSVLNQVGNAADAVEVEKYRALCLLALDRPKDAEKLLEQLTMERPLFSLNEADTSPRLVALFQAVRKRTLPEAAKQTYQRARASYENKDMAEASRQFKEVVQLADTAPPEQAALLADLKMLATGFLKLSETGETETKSPARAPQSAPVPATTSPVPPPNPGASAPARGTPPAIQPAAVGANAADSSQTNPIYDASNKGVTPPVGIDRTVPVWTRPPALRGFTLEGLLELVIDEQGRVVNARMAKGINPGYDRILLSAVTKWQFQPAKAGDHAVRYRAMFAITANP
jgi:TonB family protein